MSDSDVASAFFDACFDAWRASSNQRPLSSQLFAVNRFLRRHRLHELAQVAGQKLPPPISGDSAEALHTQLSSLCDQASAVREFFRNSIHPEEHARGSVRRLIAEIPQLRDDGQRGLLHAVSGKFNPQGAEDELRPYFESVATLGQVLGLKRPRDWRSGVIHDWAAWCDAWERVSDHAQEALRIADQSQVQDSNPPAPIPSTFEDQERKEQPPTAPAGQAEPDGSFAPRGFRWEGHAKEFPKCDFRLYRLCRATWHRFRLRQPFRISELNERYEREGGGHLSDDTAENYARQLSVQLLNWFPAFPAKLKRDGKDHFRWEDQEKTDAT